MGLRHAIPLDFGHPMGLYHPIIIHYHTSGIYTHTCTSSRTREHAPEKQGGKGGAGSKVICLSVCLDFCEGVYLCVSVYMSKRHQRTAYCLRVCVYVYGVSLSLSLSLFLPLSLSQSRSLSLSPSRSLARLLSRSRALALPLFVSSH